MSRQARAFTLLETMLAAAIGALVVLACMGLFFLMNRTDRAMEARANEQAELERLRIVMERTFSTLLMSDEPRGARPGEVAVATAVEKLQDAFKNGQTPPAPRDLGAGGAVPEGTSRFNRGSGSPEGTFRFNRGTGAAQPGSSRFARERTQPAGGDKADKPTDPAAGDGQKTDEDPKGANRLPPPARLDLSPDQFVAAPMVRQLSPNDPAQEAQTPQRLEVVLFQSPVPTDGVDPVELALHSIRRHRSPSGAPVNDTKRSERPDRPAGVDQGPSTDEQQAQVETLTAPVRAVRGAFEVRPQPRRGVRTDGAQVIPASFDQNPTGLWQVWWTPLPRLDADGLPELFEPDPDSPDFANQQTQQPFLVAANLRYIKWTVFHKRERKPELTSIWSGDLPAYVEVEAQTASGMTVNWMFEIDWAIGPEVPRKPTPAGGAAGGSKDSDKAGGGGDKAGQPGGAGGAGGTGGTGGTGGVGGQKGAK